MPIHDWSRIPAGVFHHFHQDWSTEIARSLNRGLLPKGLSAMIEQRGGPKIADVVAIEARSRKPGPFEGNGVLTMERPTTKIVRRTDKELYTDRANRVVIKHHMGRIVAIIEIVSPGNKDSKTALRDFVDKIFDFLRKGIHALIIDLFPPTPRDPFGIHKAIWDQITEEDFELPPGKDRIFVSYEVGDERAAYIEPVGVGDELPDMPLCLTNGVYVRIPLESTYRTTWEASPEDMRTAVETGIMPEVGAD